MEYKQGLDRVGDSTSFPFPIKLEYDENNIYLTPLWIPETSDILVAKDKITKQPINLLDANELGNLWLCIEVKDGYYMPKKAIPTKLGYIYRRINHLQRGGKYHLKFGRYGWQEELNRLDDVMQNHIEVGSTYTFPYLPKDFKNHGGERSLRRIKKQLVFNHGNGYDTWFIYIRGTYRYGGTKYKTALDHKRTGIYSNVVKLEFDLDLEDD